MLPLPMTPETCLSEVVRPALAYLPAYTRSPRAEVMLVAIALQESGLRNRWQVVDAKHPEIKGPARGLWQFERGSKASRGGVWGVFMHHATHELLRLLCRDRDCNFEPYAIWAQLEHDDVLAAAVARLLLVTDPYSLPQVEDKDAAWNLYAERTWRPGKPHAGTWAANHAAARKAGGL
jgi:hypothetical protein